MIIKLHKGEENLENNKRRIIIKLSKFRNLTKKQIIMNRILVMKKIIIRTFLPLFKI